MAINKPDFLAGYSLFYESARYGADFLAAIEINRDLLAHARTSPSRRAGTQSPSLRDLLALARTSPSRRAGTQSPSLRDLLAHARTSPSRLRRGWANKQKAPSSKLVVLFDLFAVRGGFEPPVRLPVRQFSKLVV